MNPPDIAVRTVCLDCDDAHAMAGFYGALLGWEPTFTEPEWVLMRNPDGGIGLSFQAEASYRPPTWPEQGDLQQKMIHLDVRVTPSPGQAPEAALADALKAGRPGGAAFDVFADVPLSREAGAKLAGIPNLILTPHIAGVTEESNIRVSALIAERVLAHLEKA